MIERIFPKISLTAFFVTIILFVVSNGLSYLRMQFYLATMNDGYAECGFPFSFYGYGGFAPVSQYLWEGLIADYCIAVVTSVAVGRIWKRVYSVSANRRSP